MQIVYWAHSYRKEDAQINRHFGLLIEQAEKMIINFDPPSASVNESKLMQNLHSCDGMIAVLTWRGGEPSPYILYEIVLALRARKPLLVFLDDRLRGSVLPSWIAQVRYSHRTFFRQVREQVHGLRALKSRIGESPPAKNRPSPSQRGCGLIGTTRLNADARSELLRFIDSRGYQVVDLEKIRIANPLRFEQYLELSALDVVVSNADARTSKAHYWAGMVHAAAMPTIVYTTEASYSFSGDFPREFQPSQAGTPGRESLDVVLRAQFDLFEQDFLGAQDPAEIERYVKMQIEAGVLAGNYEAGTRQQFIGAIVGDQYNIHGQAGAVGPGAHAHDMSFQQAWSRLEKEIDLDRLVPELRTLRDAMERDATDPGHKLAAGALAAAVQSAEQKEGPQVLEYLKTSGKWALATAEKLGIGLAVAALKTALGL